MVKRTTWIGFIFLVSMPVIAIFYLSVISNWQYPALLNVQYTERFWLQFFTNEELTFSLLASVIVSLVVSFSSTFAGFFTSRWVAKSRLLIMAFFPYLIAPVILASLWQIGFIYFSLDASWFGIVVAQFLFIYPYSVLFLSSFWNKNMFDLGDQAKSLGATERAVYRKIWIPLAKPFLSICLFQCFVISWFEYGLTQLIGVGKVRTMTVLTMRLIQESNLHLAAVVATIMTLPLLFMLGWKSKLFLYKPVTDD